MKRLLLFALVFALLGAPVLAQQVSVDPAAYLPARAPVYVEIRLDDAALTAYNQALALLAPLSSGSITAQDHVIDKLINPALALFYPGLDFQRDIQPWVGDRIALSAASLPVGTSAQSSDLILVLPVRDPTREQAFLQHVAGGAAPENQGGVKLYTVGGLTLAVGESVMWAGTRASIDQLFAFNAPENLTQNPAYQKVRAALPADAEITSYLSGQYLFDVVGVAQALNSPGAIDVSTLWEAALRLHPARSAAEDALLKFPTLDGMGQAIQLDSSGLHMTAALSLDAQYAAPTLTTATAGTALLGLLPADSFVVFDSYDASLLALPVTGLALLGPAIGNIYTSIVSNLEGTPTATPSPTPTPEPITADTIIAQAQPIIAQAESLIGMSLDEFYGLVNGEYAIAVFPGIGPTIGAALYLHSSDPQRLIDTVDHVSKLILTNPATGAQLITPSETTIGGVNVTLLAVPGLVEPLALGIVDDNVLFLTLESLAPKVIDAAAKPDSSAPVLQWRDRFGTGQEALFYADVQTLDLYNLRVQRVPPLPIKTVAGSFDVRDNGLFVLNLTAAGQ